MAWARSAWDFSSSAAALAADTAAAPRPTRTPVATLAAVERPRFIFSDRDVTPSSPACASLTSEVILTTRVATALAMATTSLASLACRPLGGLGLAFQDVEDRG